MKSLFCHNSLKLTYSLIIKVGSLLQARLYDRLRGSMGHNLCHIRRRSAVVPRSGTFDLFTDEQTTTKLMIKHYLILNKDNRRHKTHLELNINTQKEV